MSLCVNFMNVYSSTTSWSSPHSIAFVRILGAIVWNHDAVSPGVNVYPLPRFNEVVERWVACIMEVSYRILRLIHQDILNLVKTN